MGMNPLPPQAFTKETLQRAYQWLLQQNSSIKEIATSQDVLVSLYLKAQRNGEASLETPTIQNFKQELKSLAHLIGDLNGQTGNGSGSVTANAAPQNSHLAQTYPAGASIFSPNQPSPPSSGQNSAPPSPGLKDLGIHLDSQSLSAIAEVRTNLNLGSDSEALRALISVGYKHLRRI